MLKNCCWLCFFDVHNNLLPLSLVAVVLCRSVQRHFKSKEVQLSCFTENFGYLPIAFVVLSSRSALLNFIQVYLHTNCIAVLYNVCAASRCCIILQFVMIFMSFFTCASRDIDAFAAQRIMNMSVLWLAAQNVQQVQLNAQRACAPWPVSCEF